MKVSKKRVEHKGLLFNCRDGFSDEKTFDEVVVNKAYKKKGFNVSPGETWIDLGGNVGAFAVYAVNLGAKVEIYEPDPFNCKMIEENMSLNGFEFNLHQKAVVANNMKKMKMYVGNNKQVWRNSLYKDWGNESFNVDCVHFSEVITKDVCVKMDIEGAEMQILESMDVFPKKMVFEWSLDIDGKMSRYRDIVDKMKSVYENVYYSNGFYEMPDDWLPNYIFPKADNIYCY